MVGLADAGIEEIRVVNRTIASAEALAALAGIAGLRVSAYCLDDGPAALAEAGIVINTTSLGMSAAVPLLSKAKQPPAVFQSLLSPQAQKDA